MVMNIFVIVVVVVVVVMLHVIQTSFGTAMTSVVTMMTAVFVWISGRVHRQCSWMCVHTGTTLVDVKVDFWTVFCKVEVFWYSSLVVTTLLVVASSL